MSKNNVPVTVYWYGNGVRVVLGEHSSIIDSLADPAATFKRFDSLQDAADQLQPSNRAQSTIRYMLEAMK